MIHLVSIYLQQTGCFPVCQVLLLLRIRSGIRIHHMLFHSHQGYSFLMRKQFLLTEWIPAYTSESICPTILANIKKAAIPKLPLIRIDRFFACNHTLIIFCSCHLFSPLCVQFNLHTVRSVLIHRHNEPITPHHRIHI